MSARKSTSPILLVGGGADATAVRYASGFTATDPFLFLRGRGGDVLVVSMLELGRAQALRGSVRCLTPADLPLPKGKRGLGDQALALLRHLGLKGVGVTPACPVGLVRTLEAGGVRVKVVEGNLFPERLLKNPAEIRALREAQRAAVSAMAVAVGMIRASRILAGGALELDGKALTSERVRAGVEMDLLQRQFAAEADIIVAGGDQGVDPHERGHGKLFAGQTIVLDIFPRSRRSGYWGDITRTVLRGKPSAEQRRLYNTVLKVQRAALERVRPGVSGAEIHREVAAAFEAAGYVTGLKDGVPQGFIHSTGHGVGLDIHEAPSISPLGGPLEAGHVVTIEPGLYYRGIGGVRIEDTVVVTDDGCSPLARAPKVFAL